MKGRKDLENTIRSQRLPECAVRLTILLAYPLTSHLCTVPSFGSSMRHTAQNLQTMCELNTDRVQTQKACEHGPVLNSDQE